MKKSLRVKLNILILMIFYLFLFQGCVGISTVFKTDKRRDDNVEIKHGIFLEYDSLFSNKLNYSVYYRVYIPFGYEDHSELPTIYVTDGQDYSYSGSGRMINTLDNLIYQKRIKPVIAVFIDSRVNPDNGKNLREKQFMMNSNYADFFRDELVPLIDSKYKTIKSPDGRAILGTSLGGINSAYFGFYLTDTFHLIGANSPAFTYKAEIFSVYEKSEKLPLKIIITTGTVNDDAEDGARRMKFILKRKGYIIKYIEVLKDHSWQNWRPLVDDILIYFFDNSI